MVHNGVGSDSWRWRFIGTSTTQHEEMAAALLTVVAPPIASSHAVASRYELHSTTKFIRLLRERYDDG